MENSQTIAITPIPKLGKDKNNNMIQTNIYITCSIKNYWKACLTRALLAESSDQTLGALYGIGQAGVNFLVKFTIQAVKWYY